MEEQWISAGRSLEVNRLFLTPGAPASLPCLDRVYPTSYWISSNLQVWQPDVYSRTTYTGVRKTAKCGKCMCCTSFKITFSVSLKMQWSWVGWYCRKRRDWRLSSGCKKRLTRVQRRIYTGRGHVTVIWHVMCWVALPCFISSSFQVQSFSNFCRSFHCTGSSAKAAAPQNAEGSWQSQLTN